MTGFTLAHLLSQLQAGNISVTEVVDTCLKAGDQSSLNAFITRVPDPEVRAQAQAAQARYDAGTARPLEGVPLGIKDVFCTPGIRTTAGSKMLETFVPPYDSTVTEKLKHAGAIFMGKTNMDEFAMGSANIYSAYGKVTSPLEGNIPGQRSPGGSSGGSAAAVAAGLVYGSMGTDTGGSVRQPAAFTGTVGLKPTYGRISRWGVIAFASSLDHPGPMARTVEDVAHLYDVVAGYDSQDSTSVNIPVEASVPQLNETIQGMKIGIPKEYESDDLPPQMQQAWDRAITVFKQAGCRIIPVSLPHTAYAIPCYYILAPAEASSNLACYDGVRYTQRAEGSWHSLEEFYGATRNAFFGPEVKRRILTGTFVLSQASYQDFYLKAQKVRRLIAQDFTAVWPKVDALLTPTTLGEAPLLQAVNQQSPLQHYWNDLFTAPANLAGVPAISFPAGRGAQGLPLGLQLMTAPWQEAKLLRLAHYGARYVKEEK